MAPELLKDKIIEPLIKCDIFALGVILFNLTTGQYPFDSVLDQSYSNFMNDIATKLKERIHEFEEN